LCFTIGRLFLLVLNYIGKDFDLNLFFSQHIAKPFSLKLILFVTENMLGGKKVTLVFVLSLCYFQLFMLFRSPETILRHFVEALESSREYLLGGLMGQFIYIIWVKYTKR
ncbi:hypothetical protein ACJX0J_016683, partial [Zea mays]